MEKLKTLTKHFTFSPTDYSYLKGEFTHIWALTRENLSLEVCEQQRHRPACASAQSGQHLCYSLIGKYHI